MPDPQRLLDELAAQVSACRRCALGESRKHAVPGEGGARARVMFVGEAPGADEDEQGRPFVGRAGALLRELIAHVGMDQSEYFIGNVLKCRPPGNRDPEPLEIESCRPWLYAQLAVIKPLVVVTLGRFSMGLLINPKLQISKARGQVFPVDGQHFLPMYHPAAILRNPRLKDVLIADFQKLALLVRELDL